jgi:Tfp pilus assembly protein PilN
MNSLGLTISNNQAVMVLLEKKLTGDPLLEHCRLVSLKDVKPEDREGIILSNMEGFIDENKGDRDNLFLGIPGSKVIVKRLSLPSPTEENLKEVLGFEMDRYTPFALEEVCFDFKIVKRDEAKKLIYVLLMVVKKEVIEYYLNLFQKINIKVRGIEIPSTALYNVTTGESPGRKDGLGKWLGIKGNGQNGWRKKLPAPLTRFLSKGVNKEESTEASEEAPAEEGTRFLLSLNDEGCELGVVRESAFIYSRYFNVSPGSQGTGAGEEVEEQVDQILSEIETTRLSLGDEKSESSQLVVSGSGADQSLISHLQEKERIDAQLLDSLNNITVTTGDAWEKIPCISAATGLALKGLKGVPLDVNFIPQELRPKKKKNWNLIFGVTAIVLLLLGISSFTIAFFVKERIYLAELNERVDGLKGKVREIESLQEEIAEIEGNMGSLETVKTGDVSKLDILKELTQIIPEEVWLTRFSYNEKKAKKEIEISGYAEAASEIIPLLEESEFFEDVKFKSSIVKDKRSNKEKFNVTAVVSSKEVPEQRTQGAEPRKKRNKKKGK